MNGIESPSPPQALVTRRGSPYVAESQQRGVVPPGRGALVLPPLNTSYRYAQEPREVNGVAQPQAVAESRVAAAPRGFVPTSRVEIVLAGNDRRGLLRPPPLNALFVVSGSHNEPPSFGARGAASCLTSFSPRGERHRVAGSRDPAANDIMSRKWTTATSCRYTIVKRHTVAPLERSR
jgi:hypothetical protein